MFSWFIDLPTCVRSRPERKDSQDSVAFRIDSSRPQRVESHPSESWGFVHIIHMYIHTVDGQNPAPPEKSGMMILL